MNRHAAFKFKDLATAPFDPTTYSHMKFGSNRAARICGYQLADSFFARHAAHLLANRCVVIPSPYNVVPNAATVMAEHFRHRLNDKLVHAQGTHLDWSILHRKVSYTADYGCLPRDQRRELIDNDLFFINRDFVEGKTILFIDDVRITGTHEDKLGEIIAREKLTNPCFYLYFAEYEGVHANIEDALNFAGVGTIEDYLRICQEPNHHLIVRPVKYLLGRDPEEFARVLRGFTDGFVRKLHAACQDEGYYSIPEYQTNYGAIERRMQSAQIEVPA